MSALPVCFCDEFDRGLGWIVEEGLGRCSHALVADGKVWLTDAVAGEGVEERIRALGEPAGVVQLLDRHARDCAGLARRLGVPHHETPFEPIQGAPFELLPLVRTRFWREAALWWPQERVLVCADALGTTAYYRARGERLAVHPALRLLPPRALLALEPVHVLVGHGEGLHGDRTAGALREALATSRRRIPSWLAGLPRLRRGRRPFRA